MTMQGGALLNNRAINTTAGASRTSPGPRLCTPSRSEATPPLSGGGIRQTQARVFVTLRLTSSTVRENIAVTGGGIAIDNNSTATLVRSLVTRNTAITAGGGIVNENTGEVTLTDSRVIRNAPDNCSPAGSVPGCTNPTNRITPPTSQLPPARQGLPRNTATTP